jgi:hypothetical protein
MDEISIRHSIQVVGMKGGGRKILFFRNNYIIFKG